MSTLDLHRHLLSTVGTRRWVQQIHINDLVPRVDAMQLRYRLDQPDQACEYAFAVAEFCDEIKSLFLYSVELEYRYAEDTMPRRASV